MYGQQTNDKWIKDHDSEWSYNSEADLLGHQKLMAKTLSTNLVSFGFPYQGPQRAELMVRQTGRQTEVMLGLEKGQFICNRDINGNCVIAARFDNDSKIRWFAVAKPNDLSSNVWFIGYTTVKIYGLASFYDCMRKAKTVSIETTVYQEGSPIFQFNVADLRL
jgi:hypothetical protein